MMINLGASYYTRDMIHVRLGWKKTKNKKTNTNSTQPRGRVSIMKRFFNLILRGWVGVGVL